MKLHLGNTLDDTGTRTDTRVELDPAHLTTHGVIVGMTGSGKTGLGIVLLEEALARGIPALIIDPKGDMGNLLLNFPALRAEDFAPWVEAGTDPATVAARWQRGLEESGVTPDTMRRLGTQTRFTIFTPGATFGVPLDVVGSLQAQTGADAGDVIESFVSGLLALVGRDSDPLASPDHILLSNLIARAWAAQQDLTLETLIGQVAQPPIRKLGVFELDTFMPPKERMALAVQLNSLLASPSFAPWRTGVPLDMQRILWDETGKPRAAVVYLAHLSEPERQFIVTLLMSRVVSWMRTQPGTSGLRALIYMDEVAGFAPPSAMPPSKKPMLTILKQARAHGVGMVLSTQNPVDLDYKALSNAGTWLIGRLQTERDKARVVEGMQGGSDLDALIGGLGQRQFLLHQARGGEPQRFTTRWAMSYLRGPLTRVEIEQLMADEVVPAAPKPPPAPTEAAAVRPQVAVRERFLDPAAPWAADIGAQAGSTQLAAAVAARVHLRFDDAAAGIDTTQEYECVWYPLTDPLRPEAAHAVDYDDRDLVADAPAGATYLLPDAPIDKAAYFKEAEKQLRAHLLRTRTSDVFVNRELKLYSRPGEARDAFLARCHAAADERADADVAKLRDRYTAKRDRIEKQQRAAEDRVRELDVDTKQRVQQEIIAGAGELLSAFLGGRRSVRSLGGAVSRRGVTRRTQERLDTAQGKLADLAAELADVEQELADEIAEIGERWDAVAERIESKAIGLEQADITIAELVLVWVPA